MAQIVESLRILFANPGLYKPFSKYPCAKEVLSFSLISYCHVVLFATACYIKHYDIGLWNHIHHLRNVAHEFVAINMWLMAGRFVSEL